MKRLLTIAAVILIPASAWAQVPPPVPPVPPAPPAPVVAPAPVPVPAPRLLSPDFGNGWAYEHQLQTAQEAMERARVAMDENRVRFEDMKFDMTWNQDVRNANALTMTSGGAYETGISLLSRRDYDRAIIRFDQVIAEKTARTDAALYHKAFALYRLGRSSDATAALATLKKDHPRSAYVKDATVLEAAVRESAGQAARPEQADNEELKLLALNALQHTDPERALPLLEGVLNGANSLQLKQRAIFVLAQSTQPRAREILMSLAKGGGNPDLQKYAIRYVASGGKRGATSTELRAIYDSTQDADIKRAVIQTWGQSGDLVSLVSVAGSADRALRSAAVSQIGDAGATNELWAVYQKEQDKELKLSILSRLGSLGAADKLSEVIKSERDVDMRRRAIRSLGNMRADKSGAMLADLYTREEDVDNKKAIITGLANQDNGETMVAIARKETNMTLKRDIVSRLSSMTRNKAAMDYMLEIIK
jgi:tetratricopeptide (TPR) repeat protein